jgi:hypothetical protein
MSCPYLKEVTMVFCRAYPVHKPVPLDRVTTASTCEGRGFEECPLFKDAAARARRSVEEPEELPPAADETKGARS